MVDKYKVITLCGSTRFKDEFMEAQKRLTLEGNIVISVGLFGHAGDSEVWENMDEGTLTKTKEMLDLKARLTRRFDTLPENVKKMLVGAGPGLQRVGQAVADSDAIHLPACVDGANRRGTQSKSDNTRHRRTAHFMVAYVRLEHLWASAVRTSCSHAQVL